MRFFLLLLFTCAAVTAWSQNASPFLGKTPFVLGETVQIQSGELGEARTLNIYLPPGYGQDSTRKYPVIYLLDGSADEDFIHIVGLVQFATFPWINMIPESIVVGIANVDRKRDFTFPSQNAEDLKNTPTSGGSERFIRFVEQELQPFIDRNYRTDSLRILIGQSLGGLVGTEILFKKPDLFSHYVLVSPSLWWNDEMLLKQDRKAPSGPVTVYLTAGKDEPPVMVRTAEELAKQLRQDKSGHIRLWFKVMEGQDHGNILHQAVYEAFGQVFGKEKAKGH
jgi:predicted alpha/beta superfamily hydrolase